MFPARNIFFKVGRSPNPQSEPLALSELTYSTARQAVYADIGRVDFDSRSRDTSNRRSEVVTRWFGRGNKKAEGQYLWLIVSGPHPSEENKAGCVHLAQLDVFGSVIEGVRQVAVKRQQPVRLGAGWRDSIDSSHSVYHPPHRQPTLLEASTSRFGLRRWRLAEDSDSESIDSSGSEDYLDIGHGREAAYKLPITSTVDPRTALANVRELVERRRREALKDGRSIDAKWCKRSVELIRGYEREMEAVVEKLEAAKAQRDEKYVRHYEATIADIRDACYRNVHLDLVLADGRIGRGNRE